MCLSRYFFMSEGDLKVPSFDLTSDAGSNWVQPDGPVDSESEPESNLWRLAGSSRGGPPSSGLHR